MQQKWKAESRNSEVLFELSVITNRKVNLVATDKSQDGKH